MRKLVTNGATITTDRYFLYDGWNLLAEVELASGSPVLEKTYLWGTDLSGSMQGAGGVGGLLAATDHNATTTRHAAYDGNGNLTDLIDSSGASVAHYEYDAFGNTTAKSGPEADSNPFRFSTKYLDEETGFYYYGFRHYDPKTGRWPSRDPIQESGGMNLYGMVENAPVGIWDFLGLQMIIGGPEGPVDPGDPVGSYQTDVFEFDGARRKVSDGPTTYTLTEQVDCVCHYDVDEP